MKTFNAILIMALTGGGSLCPACADAAQAVYVGLSDALPGVRANYDAGNGTPTDWGRVSQSGGGGSFSGGSMFLDGDNDDFIDYESTLKNDQGTTTEIPGSIDWAVTMDVEQIATGGSGKTIFEVGVTNTTTMLGGDAARLHTTGTDSEYLLQGGNGSGSYVTITTFSVTPGTHNFQLVYNAIDQRFDLHVDTTTIASGFLPRVNFGGELEYATIRLGGGAVASGIFRYDNLFIGPIGIPEPGTLALLALGAGIVCTVRTRCPITTPALDETWQPRDRMHPHIHRRPLIAAQI